MWSSGAGSSNSDLCYRLQEEAQVVHGDISLGSLKYYLRDGQIIGVLTDFDFSSSQPTRLPRTGLPFRTIDPLVPNPLPHLYRHDLESLFYIVLWIVATYHDGQRVANPPLRAWKYLGVADLQKEKRSFLMSVPPPPTANFKPLQRWIASLFIAFRRGYIARLDPKVLRSGAPFDDKTLGGNFSFDKFAEILNQEV
ncbi:hypothetical protein FB451DRAFT_1020824 [Mycena latifolia]|nr:hypothetical protein FB451DRAFT_1020824 [Mycena latifolia]